MSEKSSGWAILAGTEQNAEACRHLLRRLSRGWYGKVEFEIRDGKPIQVRTIQTEALCSESG